MSRAILRLCLCGAFGFLAAAAAVPQTGTPSVTSNDTTLRELLDEVRLLRRVLQESSLGSVRAQILLTERRSHDERAVQFERQLASLRSARNDTETQIAQLKAGAGELERASLSEGDLEKRAYYESRRRSADIEREQLEGAQQRSLEREHELETRIAQEESAVDAIQKDLDRIERDLAAIQKTAKDSDAK